MKKPLERFNKPSSLEDVMDCEVVLNVSESYGVNIQIEPLSLYFHVGLSIFQHFTNEIWKFCPVLEVKGLKLISCLRTSYTR